MSTPGPQPSEQELREAYEAELSRITASDVMLQAVVSLLNIGARRVGLLGGEGQAAPAEGDLEQVRDAVDGARALLPILERRHPNELGQLRDALSQLQMTYARQAQAAPAGESQPTAQGSTAPPAPGAGAGEQPSAEPGPGPAEASGRLWVPGR